MQERTKAYISTRHDLVDQVKGTLIESLDLELTAEEIDEDSPLFGYGLGLDSIDALQLVLGLEETFECSMPADDIMIYRSVNTIADYLIDASSQGEPKWS